MSKILIVDDSATMVEMVKAILEGEGYSVITASDGQEGLNKAKSESPDLIILDVMLPKMDGYKICRMLKFDEKFKHIPVVMFTSKGAESDKKLGQEVGASDFITKDISPEQITGTVARHLKK